MIKSSDETYGRILWKDLSSMDRRYPWVECNIRGTCLGSGVPFPFASHQACDSVVSDFNISQLPFPEIFDTVAAHKFVLQGLLEITEYEQIK